jgi:23S rRNA pseudouridine1911/1915/1917 synthase
MNQTQTSIVTSVQRLDTFIANLLNETRNQSAQLIKQGAITVDGKSVTKVGLKLKLEQVIMITFPEQQITPALKVNFDVEILFEDDDVLVINKPSGVTVHPAPSVKEATLVDWLKKKNIRLSTISGEERHGIVHRLDKGTSGVMVIAKNNESHEALSLQLQDKTMGRYYLAISTPPLKNTFMEVDLPIARNANNRLKMAVANHGKSAKTHFKQLLLSEDEKSDLLLCKLFTGRTHQIRVHLESMSRHILGDHIYGVSQLKTKVERILLHASVLYFVHPTTKEIVTFHAPLPTEMQNYLEKYFNVETLDETINPNTLEHHFADISV